MLLTAFAFITMASCSDSEIDSWQSKFVWFTDTLVNFSNIQQPDVAEGGNTADSGCRRFGQRPYSARRGRGTAKGQPYEV